jgi:hypothetical protein
MRITLAELFFAISSPAINSPAYVLGEDTDLFDPAANDQAMKIERTDVNFIFAYFSKGFNFSLLEGAARILFDMSFNAFDNILHAWMSELPVEREIISFGKRILAASQSFNSQDNMFDAKLDTECNKKRDAERSEKRSTKRNVKYDAGRDAIYKIVNDRGNADTLTVLNTVSKVQHEVHRMMGLLRFTPDNDGEFTAKCEPDHFILPCLGEYFTSRFGDTPWAIIDEKRGLCLRRNPGKPAKIDTLNGTAAEDNAILSGNVQEDEWETLWKHYHRTINNKDRDNPGLQRQFMPKRYWKHLPEM